MPLRTVSRERLDRFVSLGRTGLASYPNARTAFISGSLIEGFGNETSDLDVFVLTDGAPLGADRDPVLALAQDNMLIEIDYVEDVRTDTEVWQLSEVHAAAQALKACDPADWRAVMGLSAGHLDFAHRVRIGVPILDEAGFAAVQGLFDWAHVSQLICQWFLQEYAGAAEDAAGAVRAGDPFTSVLNSRVALGHAVDALLAGHGSTNGKPKWREHKLWQLGDEQLIRRYRGAELDVSNEDEDLLKSSRHRLRLASEFAAAAAERLSEGARA